MKRAIVLVIDSFGMGALPDADAYGDRGANTALHIAGHVGGPKWPGLGRLGLGNCAATLGQSLPGCPAAVRPLASWGVMAAASPGKDTTSGHWELAGLVLERPFHVFRQGRPAFPAELVADFERETGRRMLGNRSASGTEIIRELGDEHARTGRPICYTSADSVFQIAAHEQVIPLDEQYRLCAVARRLCDPLRVGRVIARPFTGPSGAYLRTANRRDFSIALPGPSVLDLLMQAGVATIGVGKIGNIFNEAGLVESWHDAGNPACLERLAGLVGRPAGRQEFIFVNLVDTDMLHGHRRDPAGYCAAVQAIDARLDEITARLGPDDLVVVTADHGCDPTFPGTDHTREYVPLLALRPGRPGRPLGLRSSLADVAATAAAFFGLAWAGPGISFLSEELQPGPVRVYTF